MPIRSLAVLLLALVARSAQAHFWLETPSASYVQTAPYGDPQKSAPCGGDAVGTPTNMVTTVTAGDLLTIRIRETITHPGHYRVSLGLTGPQALPADPPITPSPTDQCASTTIQNPAVFPVLADGQLRHTTSFATPQTFTVRIPSNVSCTNCTLQVTQYMSSHGAPCFYYHCANLRILAADAGTSAGGGSAAGGSAAGGSASAGGTATAGGAATAGGTVTAGGTAASAGGTSSGTGGGTAGVDAGTDPMQMGGCGCSTSSGAVMLLATMGLLLAGLSRRRT